jgi:hypothetical protein
VAELYSDLRAQLQPHPARRTQSLKAYRLAQHVGPHVQRYPANPAQVQRRGRPRKTAGGVVWYTDPIGGHTWTTLLHSWNEHYPGQGEDGKDWKYEQRSNFTRDAQDALARLLDPQWGLRMLPR